ncbi:MAG TPA: L,D-transpeptidase [Brevefilum sp.]|nr:L,D-transpeptidase [Brevefilum sp.]
MPKKTLSRRKFLKLTALSLGALAFRPLEKLQHTQHPRLMRVSGVGNIRSVSIHKEPNEDSVILYQRAKDDLISVYDEIESEYGPEYNPIWYRVWGGYVHRKWLAEVKHVLNPLTDTIHEEGQLGEITVPYTRALMYSSHNGWDPVYRLYYQTLHWIRDIITGPDNRPWYQLEDQLNKVKYAIPAEHVRVVADSEFDPISPDVPPGEKRIEISISRQLLTAYEGDQIVLQTEVSTGSLTPLQKTPTGKFVIDPKHPAKHMGNGQVTSDIYAYELVGVPWNCFFDWEGGIATHGTYWHNNYGTPMSRGCINMRIHEAKWLYLWTTPHGGPHDRVVNGYGTRVTVI